MNLIFPGLVSAAVLADLDMEVNGVDVPGQGPVLLSVGTATVRQAVIDANAGDILRIRLSGVLGAVAIGGTAPTIVIKRLAGP